MIGLVLLYLTWPKHPLDRNGQELKGAIFPAAEMTQEKKTFCPCANYESTTAS